MKMIGKIQTVFLSVFIPVIALSQSEETIQQELDKMSFSEKLDFYLSNSPFFETVIGILLIFSIIFFSSIFLKRMKIPRMGYFLVSCVVLASRYDDPDDLFWKSVAVCAGLFSVLMFFASHKNIDYDSRKEPMYFIFNAFTMLVICVYIDFYTLVLACLSLVASLFFVVSRKSLPHGKFTKLDADEKIMEALERRTQRKL